jgi:hypothetical protein
MERAEQKVTAYHLVSHKAYQVGEMILDRIRCLGAKQHLSLPEIKQLRTTGVEFRSPELEPCDGST